MYGDCLGSMSYPGVEVLPPPCFYVTSYPRGPPTRRGHSLRGVGSTCWSPLLNWRDTESSSDVLLLLLSRKE